MGRYNNSFISKEKQRFGLRKLSIGVASILLGTTVYFGNSVAHADSQVDTVPSDNGSEKTDSNLKVPYAVPIKPAQAVRVDAVNGAAENQKQVANSGANDQVINSNGDNQGKAMAAANDANNENNGTTNTLVINHGENQAFNGNNVKVSAVSASTDNLDQNTWGTAEASKWQGHLVNNTDSDGVTRQYYELTGYTGDFELNTSTHAGHIIIPNAVDFNDAGINIGNAQVGVSKDLIANLLRIPVETYIANHLGNKRADFYRYSFAFSKTGGAKVRALGSDWSSAFAVDDLKSISQYIFRFDASCFDTSNITNMSYMFAGKGWGAHLGRTYAIGTWDTSHVTDMSHMFDSYRLTELPDISNWDVDHVVNMDSMFKNNMLDNLDVLSNWNVGHVLNMSNMFSRNTDLEKLDGLSKWNVSQVTNMSSMFADDPLEDISGLTHWNVSCVKDMSNMFNGGIDCDLSPLKSWDVSNVNSMSDMFIGASELDLQYLKNWKVGHVHSMARMFADASIFNMSGLDNWDVGQVTNMDEMFRNVRYYLSASAPETSSSESKLSFLDLSGLARWNVANVQSMFEMFMDARIANLSPLKDWDVSNVSNMSGMFASTFYIDSPFSYDNVNMMNGFTDLSPLANWKTDSLTDVSRMFANDYINLADFRWWNFSKVTNGSDFMHQQSNAIILASANSASFLLKHAALNQLGSSDVIFTKANYLLLNGDSVLMPTVYVTNDMATPTEPLAENLVQTVRSQRLVDYQNSHSNAKLVPVTADPTNHTDEMPLLMANQQYQLSSASSSTGKQVTVTIRFRLPDGSIVDGPEFKGETGSVKRVSLGYIPVRRYRFKDPRDSQQIIHFGSSDSTVIISMVDNWYHKTVAYTVHFRYWKDGKDGGEAFKDAKVEFYYKRLGSEKLSLPTSEAIVVVPGSDSTDDTADTDSEGYVLDTDKGDAGTPGMHLVSGSFDGFTANTKKLVAQVPQLSDYTALSTFTDVDGSVESLAEFDFSMKNSVPVQERTIYYIPNTDLDKTIHRQIRLHFVGDKTKTHVQAVDCVRTASVIANGYLPSLHRIVFGSGSAALSAISLLSTSISKPYSSDSVGADSKNAGYVDENYDTYDSSSKDISFGVAFQSWKLKDQNAKFASYQLPKVAGYTLPAQSVIPELAADPAKDDVYVDVTYTPNVQSLKINYVGLDGQIISSSTVSGHTDENTKLELKAPTGYVLVTQALPTSYTFTADDNQIDVPVTATITYRSYLSSKDADLHKAVMRTISIKHPNGKVTTVVQTVNFGRNAWTNNLTGKITYSGWEAIGMGNFMAYVPIGETGYVGQVVQSVLADPKQDNLTVETGYTALSQAVQYLYIDVNGKTYDVVPSGYHVVVGQKVSDGAQLIVKDVKLTVPKIEYVTRTIIINMPNGKTRTIRQRVLKGHSFMAAHLPKLRGYRTKISEDPDKAGIGIYVADHDVNVVVSFVK